MNVLNHCGDEQVECPLCMEPFEVDDLNFFPCTCGYQICRFCWHRIRTDENELCPACRKAYPENPADFTPLSQEQVSTTKWVEVVCRRKFLMFVRSPRSRNLNPRNDNVINSASKKSPKIVNTWPMFVLFRKIWCL
jgi:hypothetical protein